MKKEILEGTYRPSNDEEVEKDSQITIESVPEQGNSHEDLEQPQYQPLEIVRY